MNHHLRRTIARTAFPCLAPRTIIQSARAILARIYTTTSGITSDGRALRSLLLGVLLLSASLVSYVASSLLLRLTSRAVALHEVLVPQTARRPDIRQVAIAKPFVHPADRFAERYGISKDLAHDIYLMARAEHVEPSLAFRLVYAESEFNPHARSRAGALGLTQLMPSTARVMDRRVDTEAEVVDRYTNLSLGFRFLRDMIRHYQGDLHLALLAYNRGPAVVDSLLQQGGDPDNGYARMVLSGRH